MNTTLRPVLIGMAVTAVTFIVWLALSPDHFWVAAAMALAAGLISGFVVARAFPYDAALQEYAADARRRVRHLYRTLGHVDDAARRIKDPAVRQLVLGGSKASRRVIATVQEQDPATVASSAALLTDKVTKLRNITAGYLRYQDNVDLYTSRERMRECISGFTNFKAFAEARLQQALDGDLRELNADLRGLEPLDALTFSQGDLHA